MQLGGGSYIVLYYGISGLRSHKLQVSGFCTVAALLKNKLNAVFTLTVMTSGADRWWDCELVGMAV